MKRRAQRGAKNAKPAESELGRRLREIRTRIEASGVYLFQSDEEVLEEVRRRRAGPLIDSDTHVRRLEPPHRRRA